MAYAIGIDKLQHVAEKVSKNVMLGPGYVDAEENDRMGVKMISGVQYKLVEHLFVRKGGITRRKVVGNVTETNIGYIEERELTAKLSVARIRFNADEFVETVFGVDANVPHLDAEGAHLHIGMGELGAFPVTCLIMAIGMSLGGATGYAINPARDLAPRIAHAILPMKNKRDSGWGYSWVPVAGPIAGAILAALTYMLLF
jgi:hypothetical protein